MGLSWAVDLPETLHRAFQDAYQLSARIVSFINKARLLSEPEVRNHSVTSGKTFDAFWRTLLYNRSHFSSAEEIQPDNSVGVSFGYWYLLLKLICAAWEQNSQLISSEFLRSTPLGICFQE